jgi:hypothetical protein
MFILRAYKYVAISFQLTHRFFPKKNKQAISQTIPDVIFACNPTLTSDCVEKRKETPVAWAKEMRILSHPP